MSQMQPPAGYPQPMPQPQPPQKKGMTTGKILLIIGGAIVAFLLLGAVACTALIASVSSSGSLTADPTPTATQAASSAPAPSTKPSASKPPAPPASKAAPAPRPEPVGILVTCQSLLGEGDKKGPLVRLIDFITASAKTPASDLNKIKAAKADNDAVVKIGTTAKEPIKSGIATMTKDTTPWLNKALDGGTQTLDTDNFVAGGTQVTKACGADDDDTEPEPEPQPEPEPEPVDPYDKLSRAEQDAVDSARSYLDGQAFSRDGLFRQLTSEYGEDFSKKQATVAINFVEKHDKVSWNKEAEQAAEQYLDSQSFSCNGLIKQLSSEYGDQFTQKQARHGARSTGIC